MCFILFMLKYSDYYYNHNIIIQHILLLLLLVWKIKCVNAVGQIALETNIKRFVLLNLLIVTRMQSTNIIHNTFIENYWNDNSCCVIHVWLQCVFRFQNNCKIQAYKQQQYYAAYKPQCIIYNVWVNR